MGFALVSIFLLCLKVAVGSIAGWLVVIGLLAWLGYFFLWRSYEAIVESDGSVVFRSVLRQRRVYFEEVREIKRVQSTDLVEWQFRFIGGSVTLSGDEGWELAKRLRDANSRIRTGGY